MPRIQRIMRIAPGASIFLLQEQKQSFFLREEGSRRQEGSRNPQFPRHPRSPMNVETSNVVAV
jgi:hypothetical protein